MKKIILSFLATCFAFLTLVFCLSADRTNKQNEFSVAMVTDFADVNDASFNQAAYEGCKEWSKQYGIKFNYYKPADFSSAERIKSLNLAIDRGYKVVVCPGYAFGECLALIAPKHPEVKFIGIDIAISDFPSDFELTDNITCYNYREEIAGYLAGYAAVKDGYRRLGFVGGMEGPAVTRFGYGFVQGADDAGLELNSNIEVQFVYAGQFFGDSEIYKYVDNWYKVNHVEVVFSCGGSVYTSVALASKDNGGKIIGVDSDQAEIMDNDYKPGMCITSAMKGVKQTVINKLEDLYKEDKWDKGINVLGLVSYVDPSKNYVQLPLEHWRTPNFSIEEYKNIIKEILEGTREVSDVSDVPPTVSSFTKVFYRGSIK